MAIGEKVVEYLPVDVPNPNLDRGIQTVQVPCSFVGRVCGVPDTPLVAFKDIKPLLQRGVFVEIQFYLRRNEQGRDHLLRKGPLSFYVFLFFDKSAQLRYRWAFRDNTEILNLAVGQMVYCSGTIMGQLKEEFVVRAGYERGTPVNESPVLLVAPTVNLRPTDQGATRSTFDAAVVSSPPIETFQSKLERLRSRNQSNQSTKATSSQQFLDLTVEVPETDKDVGETGETGKNAGSVELPGTEQSGNEPIEGADEQVSSDRGLLRKRRKRL
ncbi:hypothetical protein F4804DRAFT_328479 [Jackrogersella minutella]|nr:hypothetical protein F4804DRAFT_328479 [Jackrogersella minutella]